MKSLKIINIVIGIMFIVASGLSAASPTERGALMVLYNSTDGANWSNYANWGNGDPCTQNWYSVTCDGIGNVVGLQLYNNNLRGTIPTEIGQLTNLSALYLSNNSLSGTIPIEIGQLTNLSALYLFNNSLRGTIPTEIGKLTNLSALYLFNNSLSGTIPTEIGQLTNLSSLELTYNCNLNSDDIDVQVFIDGVGPGTYQDILDTNKHNCSNMAPIIMYLLN